MQGNDPPSFPAGAFRPTAARRINANSLITSFASTTRSITTSSVDIQRLADTQDGSDVRNTACRSQRAHRRNESQHVAGRRLATCKFRRSIPEASVADASELWLSTNSASGSGSKLSAAFPMTSGDFNPNPPGGRLTMRSLTLRIFRTCGPLCPFALPESPIRWIFPDHRIASTSTEFCCDLAG